MTLFTRGAHVRVEGYEGVAFWFHNICEYHYGCAIVIAVGDDYKRHVGTPEIFPLNEDEFCGNCGQIGCGHG